MISNKIDMNTVLLNSLSEKKVENSDEKKLRESAEEFEAMFVKMMMDSMEKTIDRKGDMIFGGRGEEIFRDMLSIEMSRKMVNTSPIGLADQLYNQMSAKIKKDD